MSTSGDRDLTWVDCLTTLPHLPRFDRKNRGRLCPATFLLGFVEVALQVLLTTSAGPRSLILTTATTSTAAAFTQVVVDQIKCQVDDLLQISFQG